ncbi:SDR family oxidoreductase [Marispirochaeta aestuarii]|uniref:SDR family oxidoreductase n=1 Tax=Marispirochaeta aestuarii TaxID=1963862 RepID=UPI0029C7A5ED|nr:SDR family oxidoreductase [Marispirochaeta aestuarii]
MERTALVSGAARGIGFEIARVLLEANNYRVLLVDIDPDGGEKAKKTLSERFGSGRVDFIAADVASETEVELAVSRCKSAFGGVSLLVNNAAVRKSSSPADLSLEDWNRVLAVNLTGPFLMSRQCIPMLRASRGSIVNICSTRALMSEPGTEAYSASKGGLASLTHALAVSLGPEVRVNSISPGWINSAGESLSLEDNRQHPAGRVGVPRDVASLVAYLASDQAGFITGQNFIVDGGMTRRMIYVD